MASRHPLGSAADREAQAPAPAPEDTIAAGTVPAGGTARNRERDIVDEVGEGSFPSSDPPSWSQALAS